MKKTATLHTGTQISSIQKYEWLLLSAMVVVPCIFSWLCFNSFVLVKQVSFNILTCLAAIFFVLSSQNKKLSLPSWAVPLLIFDGAVLFLSVLSKQPLFSLLNATLLLIYIVFGILLFNSLTRQLVTRQLLIELILYVSALVSVIGIIQFCFNGFLSPYTDLPGKWRVFSTFGNPSFLAAFLVGIIPLAIYNFLNSKKVESAIILILPVTCLILTFSRASWFSLLVILFIWLIVSGKKAFRYLVLFSLISILFITSVTIARPDFKKHLFNYDSCKGRFFLWQVGSAVLKDHWLTGIGLNQFRLYHLEYQHKLLTNNPALVSRFAPFAPVEEFCHNDFLQLAVETGLIGIIFICYMLCAICLYLKKSSVKPSSLEFSALLGITALLLNALFFFPFYLPPTLLLSMVLLALISYKERPAGRLSITLPLQIIVTICGLIIMALSMTTLISDLYLKKGVELLNRGSAASSVSLLKKAIAFDPWSGENHYFLGRAYYFDKKYMPAKKELVQCLTSYKNYYVYSLLAFLYNYSGYLEQSERTILFLRTALPGQKITVNYGLALE